MTFMYYCPKCGKLWSGESEALQNEICKNCKAIVVYTGFTKDNWSNQSDEDKKQILSSIKQNDSQKIHQGQPTDYLIEIHKNVRTMKNIMVFFASLWCITIGLAILYGILASLYH